MRLFMLTFLWLNAGVVLAHADGGLSAGALAAIIALGSVASAAGGGIMASISGREERRKTKQQQQQFLRTMQEKDEDQAFDRMRYADQVRTQGPQNAIGLLNGLAGLRQTMGKSSNLDVLRRLGGVQ